ncbi:MAG: transporter associated domain-containing protein [Desulfomonilia bacterium]
MSEPRNSPGNTRNAGADPAPPHHYFPAKRPWSSRGWSPPPPSPFFIPEGKKLIDLLNEFREKRTKIAIIIDEYGSVDGLITLGDLMEEIVGDMIGEEGEDIEEYVIPKGEGIFTVNPMMPIDEFAEAFEIEIPDGDYDTVAGFITTRMERIPKPGEKLEYAGLVFEVVGADKRRIHKLVVHAPSRKEE